MDSQLANMIAAGEVVERPSGIVKELVENALDAEATSIEIEVQEGGMRLIKVSDNGIGMNREDLQNAFKRHSTSKIKSVNDLNHINSFGFRGEALPSIASVSLVTMQSNDGNVGHEIIIDNGVEKSLDVFARNQGTTILVENLFNKVPARLKYIKSVKYEMSIIIDVVQKFAIAHPEVAFTLKNEDKISFNSYGNGNLTDVFYRVFGRQAAQDPLIIKTEDFDFEINAIFSQPQNTRANRHSIWVYINDRMIRHFRIQNAAKDGFRRHIPSDRYPIGVIKIYVDPQLVDVNVHPSKWEIRLSKEKELVSLITNAIEEKLNVQAKVPKVKIEVEQTTMIDHLLEAVPKVQTEEPSFKINSHVEIKQENNYLNKSKNDEYQIDESQKNNYKTEPSQKEIDDNIEHPSHNLEPLTVLSQMSGKYILCEGSKGLYIVDQHAAMERVRYEYFQDKLLNQKHTYQPLLFPLTLEGRASLVLREAKVKKAFETLHIQIDILDDDTFVIRERPQWMKEDELAEFSNEILDYLEEHKTVREEDFRNQSLATLACHSSVRFNEYMSKVEMEKLIADLRVCRQPLHCPHGRPTLMLVDHDQLWKAFLR